MRLRIKRLRFYRWIHRQIVEPWVLPQVFGKNEALLRGQNWAQGVRASSTNRSRIWFHAASEGELETFWSVLTAWLEAGGEAVVTVFSPSALPRLEHLARSVSQLPGKLVWIGRSPWEGRWGEALLLFSVRAFVTTRYEAWPELWASLAGHRVPLFLIGARMRPSLNWGKRVLQAFSVPLPQMMLLPHSEKDQKELETAFPRAWIHRIADPRWDRVADRSRRGNPRAQELVREMRDSLPRPWGILGNAWMEDLRVLAGAKVKLPGSLWVVPHLVDPETVREIREELCRQGYRVLQTSKKTLEDSVAPNCILVDEVGFLLELYGSCDWAFVGGGFGVRVHSALEPGFFSIPIVCGTRGLESFSEADFLQAQGILTGVRDSNELAQWLTTLTERWKKESSSKIPRGGTEEVLHYLGTVLDSSHGTSGHAPTAHESP